MKDVVQLQQLGGSEKNTRKWRRGKSPKEEVRLSAVSRLIARLAVEDVAIVIPEVVFEAAPAPVVKSVPEPVEVAPVLPDFPDELLPSPAPVEEVQPVELPLELPEEPVRPRKKKRFEEPTPVEPIVIEMADKAESTSVEDPKE